MRNVGVLIGVVSLGLNLAVLAADKPADPPTSSRTGRDARVRERLQNMSPEEREQMRQKWQSMSDEERAKYRAEIRKRLGGERPSPEAVQQRRTFAEQVASLKRQHQAEIGELQAIRRLAVKEKAKETLQALEKLIARREQEHQKRLAGLQQRLQRIDAVRKGPADTGRRPRTRDGDRTPADRGARTKQDRGREKP